MEGSLQAVGAQLHSCEFGSLHFDTRRWILSIYTVSDNRDLAIEVMPTPTAEDRKNLQQAYLPMGVTCGAVDQNGVTRWPSRN